MYRHINLLPEEILKMILKFILHIPDSVFASPEAPFGRNAFSTSRVLLVCRLWLRVATPLLYRTIVLRSTAQTHALEYALNYGPYLRTYVRKLRVEGGYGSSLGSILRRTTGISDLYLPITFRSSDDVRGLCDGLHSINPQRLIIYEPGNSRETSNHKRVIDTLCAVFPTWTYLTSVDLAITFHQPSGKRRLPQLAEGLALAPSLKRLYVQKQLSSTEAYNQMAVMLDNLNEHGKLKTIRFLRAGFYSIREMDDHVRTLMDFVNTDNRRLLKQGLIEQDKLTSSARNTHRTACKAQLVPPMNTTRHINTGQPRNRTQFGNAVQTHRVPVVDLPSVIKYSNSSSSQSLVNRATFLTTTPQSGLMHYPATSTPYGHFQHSPPRRRRSEVFDSNICSRVLHAYIQYNLPHLQIPDYHPFQYGKIERVQESQKACFDLLCISKTFYSITIPVLYSQVVLRSIKGGRLLARQLTNRPHLTQYVYHLSVHPSYDRRPEADGLSLLQKLVGMLPRLQSLDSPLYPETLRGIGQSVNPWLQELHVLLCQDTFETAQLCREMADMNLDSLVPSVGARGKHLRVFSLTGYGLVRVDRLKYWDLSAVKYLKLNLSKNVPEIIRRTFLSLCPNVRVLYMGHYDIGPDAEIFNVTTDNRTLKKLVILTLDRKNFMLQELNVFVQNVDFRRFPELKEIQFADLAWPNNEHEINKSHLLRWATALKQKLPVGGEVTDFFGSVWRPRAQITRASSSKRRK